MSKRSKNENGFSAIELVLVIVIVALICVVGWLVYKNHHKTTTAAVTTTSAIKPVTTSTTNKSTTNGQQSQQQYLTISQFGFKLPLTTGIDDLIYTYAPNDGSPLLFFSTTSLDKASSSCTINNSIDSPNPFGRVGVVKTPYPAAEVGTSDEQAGTLYAQVNGYYLYWKGAQSSCLQTEANNGQPSQATLNMFNTQLPLFQTALKDAVAN